MSTGLISVLCPSRDRPAELLDSIGSLITQAARPEMTEILLALDPGDDAGHAAVSRILDRVPQVSGWTAPQRYGYAQIHRYFNELAARARGEWLMLWNDDALMLTPGWDDIVRAETPGVLWPQADYAPEINTFPIWPKAWTDTLGHVSLDQSCDFWVSHLGTETGTMRHVPIEVHHVRVTDATDSERMRVGNVNTYHAPPMVAARDVDVARLRELLA